MTYHSHKMPKTDEKFWQNHQNLVTLALGMDLPDSECSAGKSTPPSWINPKWEGDVAAANSLHLGGEGVRSVAAPELRVTSWPLLEFGSY